MRFSPQGIGRPELIALARSKRFPAVTLNIAGRAPIIIQGGAIAWLGIPNYEARARRELFNVLAALPDPQPPASPALERTE